MVAENRVRTEVTRQAFSVDESAHILGCGRTKIYDLIKDDRIRVVKIGTRTIIPKSEIDRLLNGSNTPD